MENSDAVSRPHHQEELAGNRVIILALRSEVTMLRNDYESMFVELMSLKSFIFENMTPVQDVIEPLNIAIDMNSPEQVAPQDVLSPKTPKKRLDDLLEKEDKRKSKKQKYEKGNTSVKRIPLNKILLKVTKDKQIKKNRPPIIVDEDSE